MEYENLQIEIPVADEEKDGSENKINPVWEKTYYNKSKGFAVGLDLQSKEAVHRRLNRAQRFGLKNPTEENKDYKDPFKDIQLEKINWPAVTDAAFVQTRPEAIHLYGVDNMSTKDVFDYFKDHGPDTMEWIDDHSCNVVWESEQGALCALKALSKTYEELLELNQEDSNNLASKTIDEAEEEARGIWRIGLPYKKEISLFLRQATIDDKKLPGAAKRSMYYLTHGRGGKKGGLVSSSRKRKMKQGDAFMQEKVRSKGPDVKFLEVEEQNSDSQDYEQMDVDDETQEPSSKFQKSGGTGSSVRMRMYADDVQTKSKDQDIYERIGNEHLKIEVTTSFEKKHKWTSGRKNQHRRGGSSSEEDEDDEGLTGKSYDRTLKDKVDLREGLDARNNRAQSERKSKDGIKMPDLRQKLHQNKKHLGLTQDQLNLCIEVTEISDED